MKRSLRDATMITDKKNTKNWRVNLKVAVCKTRCCKSLENALIILIAFLDLPTA